MVADQMLASVETRSNPITEVCLGLEFGFACQLRLCIVCEPLCISVHMVCERCKWQLPVVAYVLV